MCGFFHHSVLECRAVVPTMGEALTCVDIVERARRHSRVIAVDHVNSHHGLRTTAGLLQAGISCDMRTTRDPWFHRGAGLNWDEFELQWSVDMGLDFAEQKTWVRYHSTFMKLLNLSVDLEQSQCLPKMEVKTLQSLDDLGLPGQSMQVYLDCPAFLSYMKTAGDPEFLLQWLENEWQAVEDIRLGAALLFDSPVIASLPLEIKSAFQANPHDSMSGAFVQRFKDLRFYLPTSLSTRFIEDVRVLRSVEDALKPSPTVPCVTAETGDGLQLASDLQEFATEVADGGFGSFIDEWKKPENRVMPWKGAPVGQISERQ